MFDNTLPISGIFLTQETRLVAEMHICSLLVVKLPCYVCEGGEEGGAGKRGAGKRGRGGGGGDK